MAKITPGRAAAGLLALALAGSAVTLQRAASGDPEQDSWHRQSEVKHVLLISVDGLHQSDLAWWVQTHPNSALAKLTANGIDFSDASTPFPSDSFPGLIGQVTGGNPRSTGIYYDDTWNHAIFPAGTTSCEGPAPGAEVTYFEALDKNLGALDAGQGIVPTPPPVLSNPWANILQMTGMNRPGNCGDSGAWNYIPVTKEDGFHVTEVQELAPGAEALPGRAA